MTDLAKRKRRPRREPNRGDVATSRLVTSKQFEQYVNIGHTRAMEYARSIGAVVKFSDRLYRIDLNKVDADIDAKIRAQAAVTDEVI